MRRFFFREVGFFFFWVECFFPPVFPPGWGPFLLGGCSPPLYGGSRGFFVWANYWVVRPAFLKGVFGVHKRRGPESFVNSGLKWVEYPAEPLVESPYLSLFLIRRVGRSL